MAPFKGVCMDWHKVACFLKSLPTYQQIVTAIVFFLGGVAVIWRLLLGWVWSRHDDATSERTDVLREGRWAQRVAYTPEQSDEISKPFWIPKRVWSWLSKRARRWRRRKRRNDSKR